eukprot:109451-Pleurochrysis_carterae.AAC.1
MQALQNGTTGRDPSKVPSPTPKSRACLPLPRRGCLQMRCPLSSAPSGLHLRNAMHAMRRLNREAKSNAQTQALQNGITGPGRKRAPSPTPKSRACLPLPRRGCPQTKS